MTWLGANIGYRVDLVVNITRSQWSISLGEIQICFSILQYFYCIELYAFLVFKWNCPLDRIGTALLIFFIENLSVTCIWLDVRFKLYWLKYLFLPHKLQSFGYWLIFSSKKDFLDINVQCTCKKDKYCNNIIVASLRGFTIYMLCMFVCCQWALVQMSLPLFARVDCG